MDLGAVRNEDMSEKKYNVEHEFIEAKAEYKTPKEIESTKKVESEEKKAFKILLGEEK